jgi:hypothetical protein
VSERLDTLGRPIRRHGLSRTVEYRVLRYITNRCRQASHPSFKDYGGRGIDVHQGWLVDPASFVAEVGKRPSPLHEIDRIDNSKGYEPGNVRWATRAQNKRNTRRNVWVEHDGRRMTIADWSAETGIHHNTLDHRLRVLRQEPRVALSPEKRRSGKPKVPVTLEGVTYASIKDASVATGINYFTLYARVRKAQDKAAA